MKSTLKKTLSLLLAAVLLSAPLCARAAPEDGIPVPATLGVSGDRTDPPQEDQNDPSAPDPDAGESQPDAGESEPAPGESEPESKPESGESEPESQPDASESDPDTGELEPDNAFDPETLAEAEPLEEENVLDLDYTSGIHGCIDPFNINGDGQIDFDDIVFKNNGTSPVRVHIRHFEWVSESISLTDRAITENTEGRVIRLELVTPSGERHDLLSGGVDIDAGKIWPGEELVLSFDGDVNYHFYEWKAEDTFEFFITCDFEAES